MSTPLTNQPMQTHTLSAERDPMGAAILDYQKEQRAGRLRVRSSMFEDDEMPVAHLFRSQNEMPLLEQKALSLARGRILDVGAGAGCHALALQQRGMEVKAIDISPLSCEAIQAVCPTRRFPPSRSGDKEKAFFRKRRWADIHSRCSCLGTPKSIPSAR